MYDHENEKEFDPYIDDDDTKGLIKEYLYRHRSGFFKNHGGRWNSFKAIIKSIFKGSQQ